MCATQPTAKFLELGSRNLFARLSVDICDIRPSDKQRIDCIKLRVKIPVIRQTHSDLQSLRLVTSPKGGSLGTENTSSDSITQLR